MSRRTEPGRGNGSRRADLQLALRAARAAGERIMRSFRTDQDVRHKGPDQPVTAADVEADQRIRAILCGERPAYGWLSEESADRPERLERRRVWIVDPIDGTRSYVAGYAEFAVSIGLSEEGRAVLGVVYNPARDELFWAMRGGGAYRSQPWDGETAGGERLAVAPAAPDHRPRILASRSEIRRGEMRSLEADWEIRPLGSTAYKMACLAAAAGEAFLSRGPKSEWDVAAAVVVVEEAGGRVTDLRGDPLVFNRRDPYVHGLLAATPAVHGPLLERARTLDSPRLREDEHRSAEGEG